MKTKEDIRKEFAKNWEKHYEVDIFKKEGFVRRTCQQCGKNFWTADSARKLCGDPPCGEYGFIGKPRKADYIDMWKKYEKYFVKKKHLSVDRYPTICRWRDDLYFTTASIVDFQRWERGRITFEYPSDRLIVPQMSLRFNDIPNVGVTGRHLTGFVMPGQHSFGYPESGYWKDECLEYNFEFLTKVMKIPKDELTYIEDVWAMPDLSAFGPCIESFSQGLEIVNSVFMEFTMNKKRHELPMKVIDVGWGLERMAWFMSRQPSAFEVAFGPVMDRLKKHSGVEYDHDFYNKYARISGGLNIEDVKDIEKARGQVAKELGVSVRQLTEKLEPLQALYAIADHSRTLAFAITDGGLPSNAGGGYNLRVILRRALGLIDKHEFPIKLEDVACWHADYLLPLFPELRANTESIREILDVEEKKYKASLDRAKRHIGRIVTKTKRFDDKTLTTLYESYGITPELLKEVSAETGAKITIPEDFYARMTDKHLIKEPEKKKQEFDVPGLPDTTALYYDDVYKFKASVLRKWKKGATTFLVLDKTAFYPESGGQHSDTGYIEGKRVVHAQKIDGIVVHEIKGEIKADEVEGRIDIPHRKQLMKHHTATHIVNGAARRVLGEHVWQGGTEKTVDKARLDITHYDLPTPDQQREIEKLANRVVAEGRKVDSRIHTRQDAEQRFGFRIYQGGAVPGKEIRVVNVVGFDVEACGGIHCRNTKEVEKICILRYKKIQDGIVRIEFVAGNELCQKVAVEKVEEDEYTRNQWVKKCLELQNTIIELRKKLNKPVQRMSFETLEVKALEKHWKMLRKEIDMLKKLLAERFFESRDNVQHLPGADMQTLENVGRRLVREDQSSYAILISEGIVFGIVGKKCKEGKDVEKRMQKAAEIMGGSAGRKGDEWKGGGPRRDRAKQAFDAIRQSA